MAIYEANKHTYYLQKNETPKMFDPIFGGNVFVKPYNISILSKRKETNRSESEIRFEIAFVVLEIFCYKHTLFFTDFSIFRDQLTNPVKPDFPKTATRYVNWYDLTKYAATCPYLDENIVNYSKNRQKQVYFDDFQTISTTPGFLAPDVTHHNISDRIWISWTQNTPRIPKMYSFIGIWATVEKLLSFKVIATLR